VGVIFFKRVNGLHGSCFGCWLPAAAVGWTELIVLLDFTVAPGFQLQPFSG